MIPSFNFHGTVRHQKLTKSDSKNKSRGDRTISMAIGESQQFVFHTKRNQSPYQQLLYQQMNGRSRSRKGSQNSKDKVVQLRNDSSQRLLQNLIELPGPLVEVSPNFDGLQKQRFLTEPILSLDAPDVEDNFYISPMDWSTQNYIALASSTSLYTYNYCNKQVIQLNSTTGNRSIFTCVRWSRQIPQILATGNKNGQIELWDIESQQAISCIRVARNDRSVNSVTLSENTIVSGQENASLCLYDPRINSSVAQLAGHSESVLGVRFQNDGYSSGPFLASTSSDGEVLIWDLRKRDSVIFRIQGHSGAIKALDWSPFKANVLTTGGGYDNLLNTWHASTGQRLSSVQADSQITSMTYSDPKCQNVDLYTGHSGGDNALRVWNVQQEPKLEQEIFDHKRQILGLALNPDGQLLCTLGAEELMKIWQSTNTMNQIVPKTSSSNKLRCGLGDFR